MAELLGVPNLLITLFITILLVGFAAFLTGLALANTWRPAWQMLPYGLLLGFADRFLVLGLFDHTDGASISGYLIDTVYLLIVGFAAYRLTQASKMVTQYPWLYERAGIFGWRKKPGVG